jgi:pimeloyl-ACP methyl ester carboxylesterase
MKTMRKRTLTALAASGAVTLVMGTGCAPRGDTDKATDPGADKVSARMKQVVSKDGTTIAFDRSGNGPAVVLVGGALSVRSHPMVAQLVERLSQRFTVLNYDRRGRADSGDTSPYAVRREVEDLEAVIDAAGGSAFVFGSSSGAVLALEAASTLPTKITKLALYEPPFIIDDSRPPVPNGLLQQLNEAVASGRRGDAVEIFMTKAVGLPKESLVSMRKDPSWAQMEAVAHTLAYDVLIVGDTMGGKPLPADRVKQWAAATMPVLVMAGEKSEPFMHKGAQALVEALPSAQHRALAGQGHAADSAALAPVLVEFFAGGKGGTTPGN